MFHFEEAGNGCPVLPNQRLMFQALEDARFTPTRTEGHVLTNCAILAPVNGRPLKELKNKRKNINCS